MPLPCSDPAVHWNGTKAVFDGRPAAAAVRGAELSLAAVRSPASAKADRKSITRVPNQPSRYNNDAGLSVRRHLVHFGTGRL